MATVDKYLIDVEVIGKHSVDTLKQSVVGLGSAIASIGFASFINGAMHFADQIDDLAKAVGLSTERVLAFQNAVSLAGGKSEDAGKIITTFYQTMAKAADGSEEAQDALQKLGITINDLKTKGEQQLLDEAVASLAKMESGAARTAAAVEVFGKAARQLDPRQLQEALNKGSFEEAAKAIEKAAEANEKLEKVFFNLKLATLQVLEPFLGELDDMDSSIKQMKVVVASLGAAIAGAFAYKTAMVIGEIVVAVVALTKAMRGAAIASAAVQAMAGPAGWLTLTAGIAAAATATIALNKALDDTVDTKQKSVDTSKEQNKEQKAAFENAQKYNKQEQQARALAAISAKEQTRVMTQQNSLANEYRQTIINTMGIDANRAALIQANAAAEKDANDQILQLDKKITEEKAKGRGTNKEVIDELEKQKQQVEQQLDTVKALNQEEYTRKKLLAEQARNIEILTDLTKDDIVAYKEKYSLMSKAATFENQMAAKRADAQAQFNANIANSAVKLEQLSKQPLFGDAGTNKNAQELYNTIKHLTELPAAGGLSFLPEDLSAEKRFEIEKQILEEEQKYKEKIRSLTKESNQEEVSDLLKTIDIERNRYSKNLAAIRSEEDAIKKKNASMIEGTTQAYEQIRQGMTPFMMAQNATNAVWGRMSNAIDDFVETGKLSFSDLATSIIKDLIKIELKAQAMQLWSMLRGGSGGGGGSILSAAGSWLGGLLGFADGGQPPMGKPSIVGENGPELFVPRSAGTIIPNNQLGGGGQTVVNNYNSYITNTVSALDAKSVAQLFSENKKTLFGVVESARREMPMRG